MGQTPDEIRKGIEETREQMNQTVLAIKQKIDVRARMKDGGSARYLAAGAVVLGSVVGGLVWRVRSARKRK